jgi:Glutathione S-transferase, C-terminal domain
VRLDAQLAGDTFFGGASPDVADFFAAEAVETIRYVIGPGREPALRSRLPQLAAHTDRIRARPAVACAWTSRPSTFTARPDEPAIIERFRAADLSMIRAPFGVAAASTMASRSPSSRSPSTSTMR